MRDVVTREQVSEYFRDVPLEFVDFIDGRVYVRATHESGAVLHVEAADELETCPLHLTTDETVLAVDPEGIVFFAQRAVAEAGQRVAYPDSEQTYFPEPVFETVESWDTVAKPFFVKDGCPVELLEPEQRKMAVRPIESKADSFFVEMPGVDSKRMAKIVIDGINMAAEAAQQMSVAFAKAFCVQRHMMCRCLDDSSE